MPVPALHTPVHVWCCVSGSSGGLVPEFSPPPLRDLLNAGATLPPMSAALLQAGLSIDPLDALTLPEQQQQLSGGAFGGFAPVSSSDAAAAVAAACRVSPELSISAPLPGSLPPSAITEVLRLVREQSQQPAGPSPPLPPQQQQQEQQQGPLLRPRGGQSEASLAQMVRFSTASTDSEEAAGAGGTPVARAGVAPGSGGATASARAGKLAMAGQAAAAAAAAPGAAASDSTGGRPLRKTAAAACCAWANIVDSDSEVSA